MVHWWEPKGFSNPVCEMDVRPGGAWRIVMHGPGGVDYQNRIVYIEIEELEHLVYSHSGGAQFETTVTFAEQGGKTKHTVRMLFESAAELDKEIETWPKEKPPAPCGKTAASRHGGNRT